MTIATNPVPGVNLVGFFEGERGFGAGTRLGLGEIARKLDRGLERAGVPVASIAYRPAGRNDRDGSPELEAPYDTNIICLNADYLHEFTSDVGVEFFADRYSIGVWFWETSVFRDEELQGVRFVDEVWVASEFVRRAVSAKADVPVFVVPLPVEKPPEAVVSRSDLELPPGFMFLFTFNFVSAQRKNATAVVEAFKEAFAPGEGPVLVMKSVNGRERKPRRLEALHRAADGRDDIHVLDGYVSVDERNALIAACDCYVSLHRSEGYGLTMAEAMAYGKPVIATGYSGNLDFMEEGNSYLVPYRLTPIPTDWWAYSPGAEWADPDVGAAAGVMRRIYENQNEARARGERACAEILARFSVDRTAEFLEGRLDEVSARRARTSRSSAHDVRVPLLQASLELAKGVGGSLSQKAAGRSPTSFLRQLLLRAMWPHLADQHRCNSAVLDALVSLQRSLDEVKQRLALLETGSETEGGELASDEGVPRPPLVSDRELRSR